MDHVTISTETPTDARLASTGLSRLRLNRRRVLIVTGLAGLWLGLVFFSLLQANRETNSGIDKLETARADFTLEDLESGEVQAALADAALDFDSAHGHLRAPWVTPLRLVPFVGTQVRSADALSSSAAATLHALHSGTDQLLAVKRQTEDGSVKRVEAAGLTATISADTISSLVALELGPSSGLVPPLHRARTDFQSELDDLLDTLTRAEVAAQGIADFLEGPSHYLLLSANTAEMRAGTGMFLMAGVVDIEDGEVTVGDLQPTGPLRLETAVPINDPDLEANWGWMQPDREWRNLATSPRLAASAELAAAMWQAQMSDVVDGVLVIDPIGLESMLQASGPVDVDGTEISAANIVSLIAFDQYWEEDAEIRRQRLRSIAAGSFAAVSDPGVDLFTLASGLADAVAGRHLMAWSSNPVHQAAWEALEADGGLEPESVMISVLNRGANKLDTFLDVSSVATSTRVDDIIEIDIEITLANRTGPGLPDYVLGPSQALGVARGTYVGMLTVNVPGSAQDVEFLNVDSLIVRGSDGPTQVRGVGIELPAGESVTHHVQFTLDAAAARLVIEPSARVPAIDWTFDGTSWTDNGSRTLELETGDYGTDPSLGIFRTAGDVRSSQTAVPPTPRVTLSRADPTAVTVSWRVLLTEAGVDVWEQADGGEWLTVYRGTADDNTVRTGLSPSSTLCYRTSLAAAPNTFSSSACLVVPEPKPPVGYIEFRGDPESFLSAPDFVSGSSLDIRALVAPSDWTPDSWRMLVGQFDQLNNDRSWRFGIDSFSSFRANFSTNGLEVLGDPMELPGFFVDGVPEWIRVTIDTEAGVEKFWISDDGETWNQWGQDLVFDPLPLHDADGPIFIGTDRLESDNAFIGRIYYVEIRQGVDGDVLGLLDFRSVAQRTAEDEWTGSMGNVWIGQGFGWSYVDAADQTNA